MKKKLLLTLAAALLLSIAVPLTWAQDSATEEDTKEDKTEKEFTLEEITVTAEKREANVQKVPASIFVVKGDDLTSLGKMTTQEILEEIPGVDWISARDLIGSGHAQPDAGIKIRGLARKETSDNQPPSAVASYADGVFEGMGGNYDVERVEVLRGPQGTLYGRSANGGVVSFHTRDPELLEFGGNMSLATGSDNLRNIEAAVNAPLGESFALRLAARYHTQDDPWVGIGGMQESKEARVKLLYQPADKLRVMLTGQIREYRYNGGGCSQTFIAPDKFDYCGAEEDISYGNYDEMYQGTLNVDYDFDNSILSYIGSYRYYEDTDNLQGSIRAYPLYIFRDINYNPGEWFHTEEIRWASNTDGKLSWLVGANYYYSRWDRTHAGEQVVAYEYVGGPEDSAPDSYDAPVFSLDMAGHVYNYGIFTEETYEINDRMRITGGLRYDYTEVLGDLTMNFNLNLTEYGNSLNPPIYMSMNYVDSRDWDNITYKLRWEYDLTPDNMIYLLTATGFQPGDVRLSMKDFGSFITLPYDEEKLTTYEFGSKNRFFDNKLQFNVSLFYYDYEAYRNTVNIAIGVAGGNYIVVPTPLEMFGTEVEAIYLITPHDRLSFNLATLDATIEDFPVIDYEGDIINTRDFMALKDMPGTSPLTGFMRYEHTFFLPKGSILKPRLTLRYTKGYYLNQIPYVYIDMGQLPYNYQDSYVTCDLGTTWTSSDGKYSMSAYINNLFDEIYMTGDYISSTSIEGNLVYLANPRSYGINFTVRF